MISWANMDRCIITAASNKFFPSLINLLGSIHKNYPGHPPVYVYDLGLSISFKKELRQIDWVKISKVPNFAPHWRSCYTWKTYILNTPIAENNFYIDAGCQVLVPLDELFEEISTKDYVLVSQGPEVPLSYVTPPDYIEMFEIKKEDLSKEIVAAGIIGFKRNSSMSPVTKALYDSGVAGLCLGFSKEEAWKNKGVNKTEFVRNCERFRHDTTMLSIFVRKMLPNAYLHPVEEFSGVPAKNPGDKRYMWNLRLGFKKLSYVDSHILHKNPGITARFNRLCIHIFYTLKEISRRVKGL